MKHIKKAELTKEQYQDFCVFYDNKLPDPKQEPQKLEFLIRTYKFIKGYDNA